LARRAGSPSAWPRSFREARTDWNVKPDLELLSWFSYSMGQCLSAGLLPRQALEASGGRAGSPAFRQCIRTAVEHCDQGGSLADALDRSGCPLPHFYVPVVRAGEVSGRLEEAFRFLHEHCQRMNPIMTLVRNTWRFPLVCILFGWVIRTGIFAWFGAWRLALDFIAGTFVMFGLVVLVAYLLLKFDRVRRLVDLLLLQLPAVRKVETELATALFFGTFNLVYKTGGVEVVEMFDLASATVRNTCLRADLLRARRVFEERGSFEEAFAEPAMIEVTYKGLVATGALGGKLDEALDHIVAMTGERLETGLKLFQEFLYRAVVLSVGMSIATTILTCVFRTR
jgi:type II secretory pathway component PulF